MISEEATKLIWDSVEDEKDKWCARRFIESMDEHKRRYPAFIEMRVAEIFASASLKYKKFYAFRPITYFTKSIQRANSIRSQAAGERD